MSDLEEALMLKPIQPGSWRAFADPRYEASTGMFGGWTAAILLRAVIDDAARQGVPAAITVNYVDKVESGTDVVVRARLVGGSRSLQHWHSEMQAGDDDRILAYAMLVFADRRDTNGFTEPEMPDAAAPDTFEVLHPPGADGERTVYRPITGNPPFAQPSTASTCWVRDNTGRRVDYLQLALLADVNAPRSFYWSDGPRLSATMTMSVYFHGTQGEIDAVDDDYLFNETVGTRGDMSTSGQQTRLWRSDGVLLATSEQLCWYR